MILRHSVRRKLAPRLHKLVELILAETDLRQTLARLLLKALRLQFLHAFLLISI